MAITLNRSAASKAAELDRQRAEARAQINDKIGALRAQFITAIPGQEMLYLKKEDEVNWIKTVLPGEVDLSRVPLVAAEMDARGETLEQTVARIETAAALWLRVGGPLERLRIYCNRLVGEATGPAGIAAALDHLQTALADFGPV